jgi:hypothetical protein
VRLYERVYDRLGNAAVELEIDVLVQKSRKCTSDEFSTDLLKFPQYSRAARQEIRGLEPARERSIVVSRMDSLVDRAARLATGST